LRPTRKGENESDKNNGDVTSHGRTIESEAHPQGKLCCMKSSAHDERELKESDLEETFARSSGPGGQHVNKVSSAVTLRHRPTGVSVTVEDSRSQATNRKIARARLLAAILELRRREEAAKKAAREKERRRKSPRPRKLKEAILKTKRKRSELKQQRRGLLD
jgi:peptide chain release factor